jgi:hypothetical protein
MCVRYPVSNGNKMSVGGGAVEREKRGSMRFRLPAVGLAVKATAFTPHKREGEGEGDGQGDAPV